MQGRKRPVDETDTCTVYYRAPSRKRLTKKRDWNQQDLDTVEAWLDYKHGKPEKWNAILAQKDAQERIERCKALTYIHAEGTYQINPMLVNNMRQMPISLQSSEISRNMASFCVRLYAFSTSQI